MLPAGEEQQAVKRLEMIFLPAILVGQIFASRVA
jgi:hypothetical protein